MATVIVEDCRVLGLCAAGIRSFAERYHLSLRQFVKEGIPEQELLKLDNAMATRLVQQARKREAGNGSVRQRK